MSRLPGTSPALGPVCHPRCCGGGLEAGAGPGGVCRSAAAVSGRSGLCLTLAAKAIEYPWGQTLSVGCLPKEDVCLYIDTAIPMREVK